MANLQQPRIIIVGAGIAGISAANRLRQAGFTDVTILEAANRIGGRIHTVAFGDGDYPVELGANWIHGPGLGNSTFRVAEAIGALQPYRLNVRKSGRFMREDGTEIDRNLIREAINIHRSVVDEVFKEMPRQRITSGKIITVAPLIYDRLEEEVDKLDRDIEYKKDLRRALNALLNLNRFHEGDELERVTWEKEQSEYNIPPGGDVHIPGGYLQILEHLMKIVPKESLKLNTEVVSINWASKNGLEVEVIVKDGSKFKANHVIVTCSLGYLKKHHESLFKPKLPQEKVDAIHSLAIGRVNKIFLEFEKGLPLPTNQNVIFAWETKTMDKDQWYKRIFGFEKVFTKNNTYIGWISGEGAEYMERLSDAEIAKTSTQLLRKFLGKPDLPEPKSVLVTRWCRNPYALGTYTYQTKNMVPGEQATLSEPLKAPSGKPLVQFAGEALTNACTHGARDSGLKEAERLINLYSNIRVSSKL